MAGEVEFQPSEADYVGVNRDWFAITWKSRRARRRRLLVLAMMISLGGLVGYLDGGIRQAGIGALLAPSAAFLFLATVIGLHYLRLPARAKRLYRQQKTLQRPHRYSWTDEGLTLTTPSSTGHYLWSQFHQWADGRTAILLALNEQLFFFVPRRVLDDGEAADLRATLERSGLQHS
jgi:YcxB-like protein